MPIKQIYERAGLNAVTSYDFYDLLTGIAYKTFYAGKTSATAGFLRSFIFDSFWGVNGMYYNFVAEAGGTYLLKVDQDFDMEVERSIAIKGEAIVTGSTNFYEVTNPRAYNFYIVAKFRKWDGTDETDIATGTSATMTGTTEGSVLREHKWNCNIDIPKTIFKKGETIRLTIELWNKSTPVTLACYMVHDPASKSIAKIMTGDGTLKLLLPIIPQL